MIRKVRKGSRRFTPPILGVHFGNPERCYLLNFGPTWIYVPDAEDDWNKIFGWSYGLLPKKAHELDNPYLPGTVMGDRYIAAHHINSVRVAARYVPEKDCMEVTLYEYINGLRLVHEPGIFIPMNMDVKIRLYKPEDKPNIRMRVAYIENRVLKTDSIFGYTHPKKWGYLLGVYFGGHDAIKGIETPAPHDMVLPMDKVKCHKWD